MSKIKNLISQLTVISLLHLFVDFICVSSLMMALIYNGLDSTITFLLYNCVAFLMQPFFGCLIDNLNKQYLRKACLLFSCASLIIGWAIVFIAVEEVIGVTSAVFLGLGNAMFHVVGGKEALTSTNKSTPGGVFVSTGAIGVGLGVLCYSSYQGSYNFVHILHLCSPLILIVLAIINLFVDYSKNNSENYEPFKINKTSIIVLVVIILCLAIGIRSFLGFYTKMSEGLTGPLLIFLLSITAFIGKAIGGIIHDLVGPYILIAVASILGIVSGFFLDIIAFDYLFVLATNLLMPLTLDALRRLFPKKEGFAFGLAAAFLIPGYLIANALKANNYINLSWAITLITGLMLVGSYILIKDKKDA